MKEGLSGFICVKNAIQLDYCVELAARSLLPAVDELILCDSNSTDGTTDLLHSIPGARVINYDVHNPVVTPWWFVNWQNFARVNCRYPMHVTLDADEILDDSESCRSAARKATGTHRVRLLNFWRDENTLTPAGECEPDFVVRIAPTDRPCRYGEPYDHLPEDEMSSDIPEVVIFHLGFLRKREAFYQKSKLTHCAFNGRVDERLVAGYADGRQLHEIDWGWNTPLREYHGHYPPGVLEWIQERK